MYFGLNKIFVLFVVNFFMILAIKGPVLVLSSDEKDDNKIEISCEMEEKMCVLRNLVLEKADLEWEPTIGDSQNSSDIEEIRFENCSIPILTNIICQTFPDLKIIYLQGQSVEHVNADAFEECTNLTQIWLNGNKIQQLDKNVFQSTIQLKSLNLYQNYLKDLPEQIFDNLLDLEVLELFDNNLTTFSADLVKQNTHLKKLWLQSNEISDLDEVKLIEYLPELETIYIGDNEFSCVRAVQIYNALTTNGIDVFSYARNKSRYYDLETVYEIECLPDLTWAAVHYRKMMEESGVSKSMVTKSGALQLLPKELLTSNIVKEDVINELTKIKEVLDVILEKIQKIEELASNGKEKTFSY